MRANLYLVALIALGLGSSAHAQLTTQTIPMRSGWNAVFLEVDPEPNESPLVFADTDFSANAIQRVAMWTGDADTTQFISNPDQVTPESSGWLMYFASAQFPTSQPTLNTLQGGRAYLIKVGGTGTFNWTLPGTARVRQIEWRPDNYNLTGFYVTSGTGPTFATWFSGSPAHAGNPVYKMAADGQWQPATLATDTISRGEAYWVMSKGSSTFQGPLGLSVEQGGILDFGKSTLELSVSVKNDSAASTTVAISSVTVAGSPGAVPLSYWNPDLPNNNLSWSPLSATWNLTLAAHEERPLRLAVRRADFPVAAAGTRFHNLLRVESTSLKQSYDVPVFAQTVDEPREGLWVGDAVITAVSEHTADWNGTGYLPKAPTAPKPVGREFSYRLLIHVDDNGVPRLLGQALLLWKTPTQPVVLSSESRIKEYLDNMTGLEAPLGRRFTAPVFALSSPLGNPPDTQRFPATTAGATSTIAYTINLDHQDARNPFKHKYHPDHDDLQGDFTTPQTTEGVESYSISRAITLAFTAQNPEGREVPGWGDTELGGTFTETVQGLMKDQVDLVVGAGTDLRDNKITATGYFRLKKVSDVDTLDPPY